MRSGGTDVDLCTTLSSCCWSQKVASDANLRIVVPDSPHHQLTHPGCRHTCRCKQRPTSQYPVTCATHPQPPQHLPSHLRFPLCSACAALHCRHDSKPCSRPWRRQHSGLCATHLVAHPFAGQFQGQPGCGGAAHVVAGLCRVLLAPDCACCGHFHLGARLPPQPAAFSRRRCSRCELPHLPA